MKNYWPEQFEENTKPSAKGLLEEQSKLLPTLTGGIVYAELSPIELLDSITFSIEGEFKYRFDLKGKFLEDYRFNVLAFSHDITLYPVKFQVDEQIGSELRIPKKPRGYIQIVDTPEDLEKFLGTILKSDRVKEVVGSITRLSK